MSRHRQYLKSFVCGICGLPEWSGLWSELWLWSGLWVWSGLWLTEWSGLWSELCGLTKRSGLWSGLCGLTERSGLWNGLTREATLCFCVSLYEELVCRGGLLPPSSPRSSRAAREEPLEQRRLFTGLLVPVDDCIDGVAEQARRCKRGVHEADTIFLSHV